MARYASEEHEGLDYLELRKRLKEEIRNNMKKESGTATGSRNIKSSSSKDNFGSFFGPSQPVIAQRVIQESKALLENPDLAAKVMRTSNPNGKVQGSNSVRPKANISGIAPIVSDVAKVKIQEVRNARDYSFLLSDDAIPPPAPPKPSFPKKISATSPESRSAQSLPRDRNLSSSSVGRKLPNGLEVRRPPLPGGTQLKPKAGLHKPVNVSKQNLPARQPIKSNVNGRAQLLQKNLPSKASTSDVKRPLPNLPRSNPLKQQPTANSKQALLHKMASQESSKSKMIQKPSTGASSRFPPVAMQKHAVPSSRPHVVMQKRVVPSSRPQMNQPVIRNPDRLPAKRPLRTDDEYDDGYSKNRERRPAKRPVRCDDEDDDAINPIMQIRNFFRYNPNKYVDDDDDRNMLATFEDIEKEEWHSAKIARQEDEEERIKIEEEERRERLRKAKKRKMMER
ncbi:unnamed protein product [Cuscuta europaea]|uniref:Protein SPT2 homolog n=1 Tax=Cuscuta europaea TaxID=41803 RepID=A0A9P0ZQS0_CUSEU|nr:unnamed protein product [Cuscuta europaea]